MTIGVLALQGDFAEHVEVLRSLKVTVIEVRTIADIEQCQGIIIPGGESTTIGKLLRITKLHGWLKQHIANGFPVYGTCAGAILLAKNVDSPYSLRVLDIRMKRNAYGRQLDSFQTTLKSRIGNIEAAFIRAPKMFQPGSNVEVLAEYEKHPVLVQHGNMLAGTFHPEILGDTTVHQHFVEMVKLAVKPTK